MASSNIWGQLVRDIPDTARKFPVELPVSHRREVMHGNPERKQRRPKGYRTDHVRPVKALVTQQATGNNPWLLTPHQYMAIGMVAQGANRSRVAVEMKIASKTLCVHLGRVREKMHVHTTEEAVMEWLRVNLHHDLEQRKRHANETLLFNLKRAGVKLP